MMSAPRTGLLLVNLGTPAAPTAAAVRPYLREFLTDSRVIDVAAPLRWLLVNGIIAPFRSPKSAQAYETVWTPEGSPLLTFSQALTEEVREALTREAEARGEQPPVVVLGMRYGAPSLESALAELKAKRVERIVVFPLYPQYASSSTGSTAERVMALLQRERSLPSLCFVPAFYDHPAYLDATVAAGREAFEAARADHVLFSFHGLPENHMRQGDPTGSHCLTREDCCAAVTDDNRFCYRAQCFATARGLAERLGTDAGDYTVSFQSRLGREEWIKPYTDLILGELAERGKKRLAVFCPAFVADCLETLEEIGVRARESFIASGGEELTLIPCPNAHPTWVSAVIRIARESSAWLPAPAAAEEHAA